MNRLEVSQKAQQTRNPIRNIVDKLKPPVDHPKPFLNLALGDPTLHGNIERPSVLTESMGDILKNFNHDGYGPSTGLVSARTAIAQSASTPDYPVTADDVVVCSGASGALELAITVLVNPGDNILVPRPGFPLYQVITESLSASVKHYDVLPARDWECDLDQMKSLIDDRTRAILINNPSNPCGSNFSADHLRAVAALALKHGLPIIADEIYGGVVFSGVFTPMNTVTKDVPVISVGGLAKQFVVPGWRVGWIVMFDQTPNKVAGDVMNGIRSLSQLILGANSVVQACIPRMLTQDSSSADYRALKEFNAAYLNILRTNAELCVSEVEKCNEALGVPLLTISKPTGAMYAMIGINMDMLDAEVSDDAEFSRLYLSEENVSLLPGQCFGMLNFIRLVICPSPAIIVDAFERLHAFCKRHLVKESGSAAAK